MTPVPLELPLRPAEAAEVANLVFDHAEGKPLTDDVRHRLAARAAAVQKLESLTPYFGSLERDPVHHSAYYVAVDAREPLLLHVALGTAPTSSIYYRPLLIGRMRRPRGTEMVVNAIPFGTGDRQNVETFAARINAAFYPQPQGARTTITVEEGYPAAFEVFRAVQRRSGKNFAALTGDYYAAMWAAIRAGWRSPYTVAADLTSADGAVSDLGGREGYSRYSVAAKVPSGMEEAQRAYQQIRGGRAAVKISRRFDLEWEVSDPLTPECLRSALEETKQSGHIPQLISMGAVAAEDLDAVAATAQQFQVTPSFRYRGEPGETVRARAKATGGRLNYRVRDAAEAEFVAEHLL